MPTYAYRCTSCAHEFEALQKFSDDPIDVCPACGEHTRRVFHPVGIVFKGSGWYINDSRKGEKSGSESSEGAAKPSTPDKSPKDKPAASTTPAPVPAD